MGESLIIRIGANAKEFDKELKALQTKTKSLEKGLAKVAKISAAAFVGLSAAVGLAVKKFSEFERTFTNVQTLLDKSSFSTKTLTKGIADLRSGVLSLGADSGESFDILNKGLFDIVSAGIDAEEAISVLTVATDLAAAGATDTSVAVDGLTSAMNAYGLTADQAASVAQKFFLAQKGGKTTVEELSSGFGLVAATAQSFGVSLDELLASVSAVTLGGVKTRAAYTGLNAVLANISAPTKEAAKEAEKLGVAFNSQALRAQGLKGFMDSLTSSANFNSQSLEKLFGSIEAKKFVFALAGSQAKSFAEQLEGLGDATKLATTFQEALDIKQASTDKAIKRVTQSFNALTIQLGERFAPLIIKIADSLGAMAKRFSSLTDEQKDSIANFIKWGVAITAGITTLSVVALGIIKVSALLGTIGGVLFATGGAASAFWLALTGPIGLAVIGITAVGAAAAKLFDIFNEEKDAPKTVSELTKEIENLKKKQDEAAASAVTNSFGQKNISQQRLEELDKEIAKLEELKKKQAEVDNQKQDGSLILAPTGSPLDALQNDINGKPPVEVPFRAIASEEAEGGGGDNNAEVEKAKQVAAAKAAVEKEAFAKKIEESKFNNEVLKAQQEQVSAEEIEILKKRHALEKEENEAKEISNQELRDIELENIALQNEALDLQEEEHQIARAETLALNREQEGILQEELNAAKIDGSKTFNEQELKDLRGQILTKEQAKKKSDKQELVTNIQKRNTFLLDEIKHGTAVATVKQALNSSEVIGAANAAGSLVQLQNSKNKTLKAIGKKAALAQIAIDTARGALSAYTSLAGIPFVGPALGLAAAGALVAYGGERLAQVNSAQRGGVVPNAIGGSRDRVPMLLEPNELVVPKALAPDFIQSAGRPDAQAGSEEDEQRGSMVEISIEDDATDFITAKQRENTDLSIGVA